MRVAVGQYAVTEDWRVNAEEACRRIKEADSAGADLLVLPEGAMALFIDDPSRIRAAAQPIDGPFVTALREATADTGLTVVFGMHEPAVAGPGLSGPTMDTKVYNTLVAVRNNEILATYRKLHLFDAFMHRESADVQAGTGAPVIIDCAGWKVGLMTCYDVRFPELARLLVDAGAQLIALPTAWLRGPSKEWHWEVMVTARALENTCYVVGAGECGRRNIGASMIVDPLGTAIARLSSEPGLLLTDLSLTRLNSARAVLPVLANRRFKVNPIPLSIPNESVPV